MRRCILTGQREWCDEWMKQVVTNTGDYGKASPQHPRLPAVLGQSQRGGPGGVKPTASPPRVCVLVAGTLCGFLHKPPFHISAVTLELCIATLGSHGKCN